MKGFSSISIKVSFVLCILYLSWGGSFLAIRLVLDDLPPVFQNALRLLLAGIISLTFLPVVKSETRISEIDLIQCWNSAFLLMFLTGILQAFAQQKVASGIAALLFGTIPLLTILADWLFAGYSRPTLRQTAGIFGASSGIAILSVGGDPVSGISADIPGILLLFGASISFVAGSLYMRKTMSRSSLTLYGSSSLVMLFSGFQSLIASFLIEEKFISENVSAKGWLAMLFLIVFTSILGNISYCWLLSHTGTIAAVSFAWIDPVVAVVLGHFVLGEPITSTTLTACACIVLSVLLSLPCRHTASSPSSSSSAL